MSAISIFIALWKMILHEAQPSAISLFQSAIKIDIARTDSAIFVLFYDYCVLLMISFKRNTKTSVMKMTKCRFPNFDNEINILDTWACHHSIGRAQKHINRCLNCEN